MTTLVLPRRSNSIWNRFKPSLYVLIRAHLEQEGEKEILEGLGVRWASTNISQAMVVDDHISVVFSLVYLTFFHFVYRVYQGFLVQKVKRACLALRQVSVWFETGTVPSVFEMFSLSFILMSINYPQGTRGLEGNIGSPGITGTRVRLGLTFIMHSLNNSYCTCFHCTIFFTFLCLQSLGLPGYAWSSRASGRERAIRSRRAHRK